MAHKDSPNAVDIPDVTEGEPVMFMTAFPGIQPQNIPKEYCEEVSENLVYRFLHLGHAYSLHYRHILGFDEDAELNSVQCQNFIREVQFVSSVVNDTALQECLSRIEKVAAKVLHHPECSLLVEWP